MTAGQIVRLVLRRWYLVVLGVAITVAAVLAGSDGDSVHYTQFEVVVLPPLETTQPNTLEEPDYGLTEMAGLLASQYNAGEPPLQLNSSATTLYGEGVREGARVRLRNAGNQWESVYPEPVIDVQVVSADPDRVESVSARIVDRLDQMLRAQQEEIAIRPRARMTLEASPADPVVYHVGGSPTRAAAGTGLLGLFATGLVVFWLDRLLLVRRRRVAGAAPASSTQTRGEPVGV